MADSSDRKSNLARSTEMVTLQNCSSPYDCSEEPMVQFSTLYSYIAMFRKHADVISPKPMDLILC
jgi:hypothetical protein